jgi:NADH-quinone oxidoreductase subunit H
VIRSGGQVLAVINVGLLYILAVSSLSVYGVVVAGWSSNFQIPLLFGASCGRADGELRSVDRFVLIGVILWPGRSTVRIIERSGATSGSSTALAEPMLFPLSVIFFISALAETARAPFDLTEAESELVAASRPNIHR